MRLSDFLGIANQGGVVAGFVVGACAAAPDSAAVVSARRFSGAEEDAPPLLRRGVPTGNMTQPAAPFAPFAAVEGSIPEASRRAASATVCGQRPAIGAWFSCVTLQPVHGTYPASLNSVIMPQPLPM